MLDIVGKMCVISCNGRRFGFRPTRVTLERGTNLADVEGEMIPIFGKSNELAASRSNPEIDRVIFNNPATIVIWKDGTKTVVKCQENDTYSEEIGLAMCIAKKYLGNSGNFNEVFKKWIPEKSVEDMRIELTEYCESRCCGGCKLDGESFRCGYGTTFDDKRPDGSYNMTDNEIRNAYSIVFEK